MVAATTTPQCLALSDGFSRPIMVPNPIPTSAKTAHAPRNGSVRTSLIPMTAIAVIRVGLTDDGFL